MTKRSDRKVEDEARAKRCRKIAAEYTHRNCAHEIVESKVGNSTTWSCTKCSMQLTIHERTTWTWPV